METPTTTKKITKNQRLALGIIARQNASGIVSRAMSYGRGSTRQPELYVAVATMDSLVRLGLVEYRDHATGYFLTDLGRQAV